MNFNFLITPLSFVFALGIIVFVHEAGHLLVAKGFGVRVLTFSLGFGKRIWGFRKGETEYRLSLVPLGGYVRLGGENPDEVTDDPREFLNKPRWQRILVYFAGPVMNIVLAILLFAGLFMAGIEVPNLSVIPSEVGFVMKGSSAEQAGLQRGDMILSINGKPSKTWEDASFALATSPNRPAVLRMQRGTKIFDATVTPKLDPHYQIGDTAGIAPKVRPQLIKLEPGFPAVAAGFQLGDEIWAVDGRAIADSAAFVAYIESKSGQKVDIEVRRGPTRRTISVTPRNVNDKGKIGVGLGFFQHYPPGEALRASVIFNWHICVQTFDVLGKLITRKVPPGGAFSGPFEIAKETGAAARVGFKHLLYIMGFISISIALLNLMPIPILDGGQITILLFESVIRRDLSVRFKEIVIQIGFVMVLLLMAMVIWFDIKKNLPPGLLPGS
jgi:regulator of sigma E protease